MVDYLIVGAGFAGSVLAERLARGMGKSVVLCDRRNHIGGNAYDHYDAAGILVHKYGPHIFHTNSKEIFNYLSRFTAWRPYEHRVLASVDGQLVPIPINLDTINRIYRRNFTEAEAADFLASVAEPCETIRTSEDAVVSKVGRELYEKFFRGYTRKQWGVDPSQLDAQVAARIPVRTNRDDRYFTDQFQFMPKHGYTRMFENMLDHSNIRIMLNADFREVRKVLPCRKIIYTGPVDEFFDLRYGKLPYRSLQFQHTTLDCPQFQATAVVNYPNDFSFTRITEFKHLTGQQHPRTSVVCEYPCADGDPYYPIPRSENGAIYAKYRELAASCPHVHFVGRLATYRYYNMDQVVGQALTLYKKLNPAHAIKNHENAVPTDTDRALGRSGVHAQSSQKSVFQSA
jgi:UDP-galactopyranose mutase